MKLLLGHAARFYRELVLGNVAEKDRETLAEGERIERIPDTTPSAVDFERSRALVRYGFAKLVDDFRVLAFQKAVLQIHAHEVAPVGDLRPGALIEEADAPVPVEHDHAVGRALNDHADPGCGFLGLLLGLGQFLLTALQ